MAIYHFSAKIISRGKGQSAIAAAAYRSGERLEDEQAGEQKFYAARAERILFTDIMAPKDAPEWAHDRNRLWNEAERAEKRKDAQLAREIEVSLPHELTEEQREGLVKDFAREAFVRQGFAVDIAIHAPDRDSDERNHHAHLMVTRRTIGEGGFSSTKDWRFDKEQLGRWREQWANLANRHLERHGCDERIDHRSLVSQGVDREPTTHLGYAASEMAQRGAHSDRMDDYNGIVERNEMRVQIKGLNAMIEAAENEVTTSQQGAERNEVWQKLAEADRADRQALQNPAEQAFGESAREQAQELRTERKQEAFEDRQENWRQNVDAHAPGGGQPRDEPSGLQVVDAVSGAVTKLGDFILDFLGGSSAPPPAEKGRPDIRAFVTDPAARREQQLTRLAEREAGDNDRKAIERIRRDMEAGKSLSSTDIANLTRTHQEQIYNFGDSAVRQMVEDARREAEKSQGRERGW